MGAKSVMINSGDFRASSPAERGKILCLVPLSKKHRVYRPLTILSKFFTDRLKNIGDFFWMSVIFTIADFTNYMRMFFFFWGGGGGGRRVKQVQCVAFASFSRKPLSEGVKTSRRMYNSTSNHSQISPYFYSPQKLHGFPVRTTICYIVPVSRIYGGGGGELISNYTGHLLHRAFFLARILLCNSGRFHEVNAPNRT